MRTRGGLAGIDGVSADTDGPALRRIEAHADLSPLAGYEPAHADRLITAGYDDIAAIAAAERPAFVGGAPGDAGRYRAAGLLKQGKLAGAVLRNMLTDLRVGPTGAAASASSPSGIPTEELRDLLDDGCGCEPCGAVVSPAAYLADLIAYALDHVVDTGAAMTLERLEQLLRQPLGELPSACGEVEDEVRQVRICIEVLRRHLEAQGLPAPATPASDRLETQVRDYLETAFAALLHGTGTSLDELRAALLDDDPATAERLADRIRVPADGLSALLIDLDPLSNADAERRLAHVFGLADTTADHLSTSPVLDDASGQVRRVRLQGVAWDRNTDLDGHVHVSVLEPATGVTRVELFRDAARTELIAAGETENPDLVVQLSPHAPDGGVSSGLHGTVHLTVPTPSAGIRISAVPLLLALRLQTQRALWRSLDVSGEPVVDPHLVGPQHLREPLRQNPVFTLWQARHDQMSARYHALLALSADGTDAERLAALLAETGLTPESELLRPEDAALLARVQAVVTSADAVGVLESEWRRVVGALLRAEKAAVREAWLDEEADRGIALGPDDFDAPDPADPRAGELLEGLADPAGLRRMERLLRARAGERRELLDAFEGVAERAADTHLVMLRDALVLASADEGVPLDEQARTIGARLLVKAQMDGCLRTTRIAQAIESLQGLLFSIRIGQLNDTHTDLDLLSDDFDEEWKWLGSYATWRAAMMVFLYPENVLDPSLRQPKTEAFETLADFLRRRTQLSPDDVCRAARDFAQYVNDIPALRIDATCQARVPLVETACHEASAGSAFLTFLFGVAVDSGAVYVSTWRSGVATGSEHSFWKRIGQLEDVVEIVGAPVYEFETDRVHRVIYLLAKTREGLEERLVFVRYDLETREWEETGPHELELPVETTTFSAVVQQQNASVDPPAMALEIGGRVFFERMDREGGGLDPDARVGGFRFVERSNGPTLKLRAMVALDAFPDQRYRRAQYFVLIGTDGDRIVQRLFYPPSHSELDATYANSLSVVANGTWLGSLAWPARPNLVYTFWARGGQVRYNATFFDPARRIQVFLAPGDPDATLGTLSGLGSLERIAVHNSAGALASSSRHVGFQLGGERPGPFLGIFTRSSTPFELIAPDSPGVTFMRAPGRFDPPSTVSFMARIASGTLIDDDGGVMGPGDLEPPPPLPPEPPPPEPPEDLPIAELNRLRLAPLLTEPVELVQKLSAAELESRRARIEAAFEDNADSPRSTLTYLEEAFFFVPVLLALHLQRRGHFVEALDWFRTVLDYSREPGARKIYHGLVVEESLPWTYDRYAQWLLEPLDPHRIAATRRGTYTRFTLLSLIRCFLEFADAEFTRDTAESIARAHSLYETAADLLRSPELVREPDECEALIDAVDVALERRFAGEVVSASVVGAWRGAVARIRELPSGTAVRSVADRVAGLIDAAGPDLGPLLEVERLVEDAAHAHTPTRDVSSALDGARRFSARGHRALLRSPEVTNALSAVSFAAKRDFEHGFTRATGRSSAELGELDLPWLAEAHEAPRVERPIVEATDARAIPHFTALGRLARTAPVAVLYGQQALRQAYFVSPSGAFCVPPNPVIGSLASHAELQLEKIQSCRNIAGLERPLAVYSAAIGLTDEAPTLDREGALILPSDPRLAPTVYRYRALIDRAKNLVGLAQQLEAAFLSILEKRDAEYYNLLKARQDINLSLAGVRLRQLGMVEARHNVALHELQLERSRFQEEHYAELADELESSQERDGLLGLAFGVASIGVGIAAEQPQLILAGSQAIIGGLTSNDAGQRRRQLRSALERARIDSRISAQQNVLARDRLRLVGQELRIANLRADQARETMDFLVNKFTNAELYDWMTRVLEEVYASFLQQATSVAQLAAQQLAFERQTAMPGFIQADYWEAPLGSHFGDAERADQRGLTGSARLLQDIFQLDQFAFDTEQRRQQLSKTISLARNAPAEFQRFRQTGVLHFDTPMALFDRDFPGHYLRLIERVSMSVIALTPPTEGIKATLTSSGISRVVTGGDPFREETVRRPPETLSFTSPINSTGLFEFELQQQVELLRPFEGSGVATDWTFELPRPANQFDYRTIADVLLTLDYTALSSEEYRRQVVDAIGRDFSADRVFSFRHELADQWFDLNNPDQTDTPMAVRFSTTRADFLPNLEALQIAHVALFFSFSDESTFEVDVAHLHQTDLEGGPPVGGGGTTTEGVLSTRRGNSPAWLPMIGRSPVGQWELALDDSDVLREHLRNEEVKDILFVVTYSALTPVWP